MTEYLVIYVLTLSLCIAPEGKQVCEKWESEYTFLNAYECMTARKDIVSLNDQHPRVIVEKGASTWPSSHDGLRTVDGGRPDPDHPTTARPYQPADDGHLPVPHCAETGARGHHFSKLGCALTSSDGSFPDTVQRSFQSPGGSIPRASSHS